MHHIQMVQALTTANDKKMHRDSRQSSRKSEIKRISFKENEMFKSTV
jgi:hypothetical protein